MIKVEAKVILNRRGIPMKFRKRVWKKLIGNDLKINKNLYTHLLKEAMTSHQETEAIQLDIDRTF